MGVVEVECLPEQFVTAYLEERFVVPPSYASIDESIGWEKQQYEVSNVRIVERIFSLEGINYAVKIGDLGLIENDVPFQPLHSLLIASGVDTSSADSVVVSDVDDFSRVYALMLQKKRYEKELSHRVVSDVSEKHIQAMNRKLNEKTIQETPFSSYDNELVLNPDNIEAVRNVTTSSD